MQDNKIYGAVIDTYLLLEVERSSDISKVKW